MVFLSGLSKIQPIFKKHMWKNSIFDKVTGGQ